MAKSKPNIKFYVLSCELGKENRVRKDLLKAAAVAGLKPKYVKNAYIPTHKELTARSTDGKPVHKEERSYPGYVIVEMEYNDETFTLIQGIRYQWGLLPIRPPMPTSRNWTEAHQARMDEWTAWRPTALDSEEAVRVLLSQKDKKVTDAVVVEYNLGDEVVVADKNSSFNNFSGPIISMSGTGDDLELTVRVVVLSRDLPVTFKHWQVVKKPKGKCTACEGTRKNSRGYPCPICTNK